MRVAIVVPRYGREVNGGAEAHAREYARRLSERVDVTVLTTCALDYRTWADHFPAGEGEEDGVRILRFPVPEPRDGAAFDAWSGRVLTGMVAGPAAERRWMDLQGPHAPGLLQHLREEGGGYDAVLFIPYLYATTVDGLPLVADRAVLVPAMHDEPPLRLGIYDGVIGSARRVLMSTEEERALAFARFGAALPPERTDLVGVGVEPAPAADPDRFRAATGRDRPYVLCLGRIEPSKGSDVLLRAHGRYRRMRPGGPDLVMIGRPVMPLPTESWLVTPGFVEEELKHDAIAGALALVCPSPYESLSLVLLEAWSHGVPTISSEVSPVLVGQSRRAGAGLWYADDLEYAACVDLMVRNPALVRALGHSGRRFVGRIAWPDVIERLLGHLRAVAAGA
jgi:glycosyltransferase involved in cell wall biosynthesis